MQGDSQLTLINSNRDVRFFELEAGRSHYDYPGLSNSKAALGDIHRKKINGLLIPIAGRMGCLFAIN